MDSPELTPAEALDRDPADFSRDDVRAQADKICRSAAFNGKKTSQKLLRYVVDETCRGVAPSARAIAVDVLGRDELDPGDSLVRKDVANVRKSLRQYYEHEGPDDYIVLHIPEKQYAVFWKHSAKTLVGKTESTVWPLRAAKLSTEDEKHALATSKAFWPELASAFSVHCDEEFHATLDGGHITLPDGIRLFFDAIGSRNVFITSCDRAEVRIYPLKVWVAAFGHWKQSNDASDHMLLRALQRRGKDSEIEGKGVVTVHSKLLDLLNLPLMPFQTELSFHPSGYVRFSVPEPPPRPAPKCELYLLSYCPDNEKFFYVLLVGSDREEAFLKALRGTERFDLKAYGTVLASGIGDPPDGLKERLKAKYDAVIRDREE